jgi:hypothetical protein
MHVCIYRLVNTASCDRAFTVIIGSKRLRRSSREIFRNPCETVLGYRQIQPLLVNKTCAIRSSDNVSTQANLIC